MADTISYLKTATSQLLNAVNELQRDKQQSRQNYETLTREVQSSIEDSQSRLQQLQAQEREETDGGRRDMLRAEMRDLQKRIDADKRQLSEYIDEQNRTQQAKDTIAQQLSQTMQDIERHLQNPVLGN